MTGTLGLQMCDTEGLYIRYTEGVQHKHHVTHTAKKTRKHLLQELEKLGQQLSTGKTHGVHGVRTESSTSSLCSVEGGELFDRIIDENCTLTELDTILFMKQICEGIRYMHQMYILHLDLKVGHVFHAVKCKASLALPPWSGDL